MPPLWHLEQQVQQSMLESQLPLPPTNLAQLEVRLLWDLE